MNATVHRYFSLKEIVKRKVLSVLRNPIAGDSEGNHLTARQGFLRSSIAVAFLLSLPHGTWAQDLPKLAVQRAGNGIVFSWEDSHLLENAPAVAGPWTPVAGATSPHPVTQLSGARYFRLRRTYPVTVSKSGTGTGTVQSTPSGIDCGVDCTARWISGGQVTLRATPAPGSTFAGWSGDCVGNGDCQLVLDGPKSATATFTAAVAANPIVNGGFEQGPNVGWQQQPGSLIYTSAQLNGNAFSGNYSAYLGYDQDSRRLARIGQQVALPNTTPLFLNFAALLYSEELCDVPYYDNVAIYIGGQTAFQNERICRGSETAGWQKFSIDISTLAGQSVPIVFEISSADSLTSYLVLDDIAISGQAWAF